MNAIGSTAITILEFILAFGALVLLHELGHFFAARLSKIEVEEFGLGYPPKMFRLFRAGGTDFTINWIPFGGFCRMKGENGEVSEPGSFLAARPSRRLLTLLGGPLTNLLVGMLIISFSSPVSARLIPLRLWSPLSLMKLLQPPPVFSQVTSSNQ